MHGLTMKIVYLFIYVCVCVCKYVTSTDSAM